MIMTMPMRSLLLFLLLSFLLASFPSFATLAGILSEKQQNVGIIYIEKLPPPEAFALAGKESSTIDYDEGLKAQEQRIKSSTNLSLYVEVVGVKKVKITQKQPEIIKGLNPAKKYLMKIYTSNGKDLITQFYFSCKAKGSNKLKLNYNQGYNTWRLDAIKR